jgi:hypothetical protein
MFPVYGGKCFLCKSGRNWVDKFSQRHSKIADDIRPSTEVAETTVKNFYSASFDALVKGWNKSINVGGGYVEKLMLFPGSNITCLTFYIHL